MDGSGRRDIDDFRSERDLSRRRAFEARSRAGRARLLARAIPGLPLDGDPPETRAHIPSAGEIFQSVLRSIEASASSSFADAVSGRWNEIFPGIRARPSRMAGNILFLAVRSSPALFALRPRLPEIRRKLAAFPGAPQGLDVKLEVRP